MSVICMDWVNIHSVFSIFFVRDPAALGIAIALGAVWLACYWPPLIKKPWLWAVLVSSALLTLAAVSFIQGPLIYRINEALHVRYFVEAIPLALLIGLVQEGSKLVPVVFYWWRSGKNIDPKLGLVIGAVAGAGFGILQAWWGLRCLGAPPFYAHDFFNFAALYNFWHIFFIVAAQIAFSALAGYGLAKGRGWQFYLIASFLHSLLDYGLRSGLFFSYQPAAEGYPGYSLGACIYTAVLSALVTGWALWLRWRKTKNTADPATSSP